MRMEETLAMPAFSCDQMFDLAADIERYPEFMPGWISARVLQREGNRCGVRQVLGIGPLRVDFASEAVLSRPQQIDVHSEQDPFRDYRLSMHFAPQLPGGCMLRIAADLQMRSPLLQRVVNRLLPGSINGIVAAFEARARRLYGLGYGVDGGVDGGVERD